MSERLPPIPTPSAQVWRQLRLQYLPVLIFVVGIVAAGLLWTQWVAPPTLVGEAESIRTELRAAQSGLLGDLRAEMLQPVTAGQIIGHVIVTPPQLLEASLAVIRAEIEVLRTTTDMNFERLWLDWMSKRVELVSLQSDLHQAEATLARVIALHRIKLVTDEQFDEAKNARDAVEARLKALADLIRRLEPGLQTLESSEKRSTPAAEEGLRASIEQKEAQLRLLEAQLAPQTLVAPIDGVVTQLYRRSGENVTSGEPILQISATRSERIVGFLRPPFPLEPQPGMEVEVRTRTFLRRIGTARITQVGQVLEPISPTLLAAMRLPVTAIPTDVGLRVHVTPPQGLTLRPGEQVDLIIID